MEKLSLYIQELVDEGAGQPISIFKDGPAISHIFLGWCLLVLLSQRISVSFAFFHVETFYGKFELRLNLNKSKFYVNEVRDLGKYVSLVEGDGEERII